MNKVIDCLKVFWHKSKDTIIFLAIAFAICAFAVGLDFLVNKDREFNLELSEIQDMIYSPDDNAFYVEYNNVFGIGDKEYIILNIEENDFVSLAETWNTWDYDREKDFKIKRKYLKDVDDYIFEVVACH